MTFSTSIQTFDGTHASHDIFSQATCAVDWANDRLWMASPTDVAKYKISTGNETASVTLASTGGSDGCVGWDGLGHIYLNGPNSLGHGGITQLNATSLALITQTGYPAPFFGAVNIVASGDGATMANTNFGNSIINLNNTSYTSSSTMVYQNTIEWPDSNSRSAICSGPTGVGVSYLFTSPGDAFHAQKATLHVVDLTGSPIVIAVYAPTDFDSSWTGFAVNAMLLDRTDNNLICNIAGGGSSVYNYIVKIDRGTGAIIWSFPCTTTSGEDFGRYQWSQSRIKHGRLGWIQESPTWTIVVIDTTTGTLVSSQTTGLAGLHTVAGYQAYDDTRGVLIALVDWTASGGGPTPLNASTAPFQGWAAIYITSSDVPIIATDTHATYLRIWGNWH